MDLGIPYQMRTFTVVTDFFILYGNSFGECLIVNKIKTDCPNRSAVNYVLNFCELPRYISLLGTAVAQWIRCCATNRKVAVSIPADVIGIFH